MLRQIVRYFVNRAAGVFLASHVTAAAPLDVGCHLISLYPTRTVRLASRRISVTGR